MFEKADGALGTCCTGQLQSRNSLRRFESDGTNSGSVIQRTKMHNVACAHWVVGKNTPKYTSWQWMFPGGLAMP